MLGVVVWFAFNSHFSAWYGSEVSYVAPVYAGVNMEGKVEAMKEDILNRLMACESAGHSEDAGIIVFDSNKEPSVGQLQFQRDTVRHFYKVLYDQEITRKDAVMIALDTAKARQLASDIIWKVDGGVYEWANCARKTGIVPEITTIKKLYE